MSRYHKSEGLPSGAIVGELTPRKSGGLERLPYEREHRPSTLRASWRVQPK